MPAVHVQLSIISIHALLAESDGIQSGAQQATAISIHALLAESDHALAITSNVVIRISIHALLAESDYRCNYIATDD